MVRLTCNDSSASNLTSPGYPQHYGYNLNIMWNITAPLNKGIAILFQKFSTEKFDDVLGVRDPVRAFNSRNYSGTGLNVPPFLSTGSYLRLTFQSDGNQDCSGFHLALHCFDKSERTQNVRLKSSMKANEGILEVFRHVRGPRLRDHWIPVCTESLNSYLAELTCRQLGFPGVYQLTNETNIQYKDSTCASIVCDKSNFLLQQCVWNMTQQEPSKASRLQCFNFAYRGCYLLATNYKLYLRSNDTDVDECIHKCSMTSSELAAITGDGCYCFNVSQSSIHTEYPDDSMCARTGYSIHVGDGIKIWAFHYNATVGVCEHPGDVDNGWWSSNYTHLGSTLKLSCQTGYVVNGSEFIECKPNVISMKGGQDWDKTIPECQRATETPKPTQESIGEGPLLEPWSLITIIIVSLSSIVAGVVIYGYCKSKDCRKICLGFTKTFPRKRQATRYGDDISLSSNMSTSEKYLHVNSSQVCLNPPEPNRQDEQQSRVKGEDTSVAMLSVVECATVNKDNHDTRNSSTDLIKCGSRTDDDDVYTDIPTKLTQIPSCVKSHTMKNRPLPDCPKGGLIKPPVHDYIDMGNIPARVSDCPNATRLRESSNFGNDTSSDQRIGIPVNIIPTPDAVADTDVDAFGYLLSSSSASMSTMERSRVDNRDEYGYQTLSKREESAYTDLI
ncbi:CUB and sushi domain-containing protein 3-like isoform X2 [Lytechinus pictus]